MTTENLLVRIGHRTLLDPEAIVAVQVRGYRLGPGASGVRDGKAHRGPTVHIVTVGGGSVDLDVASLTDEGRRVLRIAELLAA